MPGDNEEELSEHDQAALDAYEKSVEGADEEERKAVAAKPASREERLSRMFLETPEAKEYRLTADSVNSTLDLGDTATVEIKIPKQFLRLVEFLEQKRALEHGVAPSSVERVLTQELLNGLHNDLHWLVVQPTYFSHYKKLWNRFCDEQGAPEAKISET